MLVKHLMQPEFTNSTCRPFVFKNLKRQKDPWYIYQNELDKASFQNTIAYGDFKDLSRKQLLIEYCMMKHLILLKIKNMMNVNLYFLQ